MAVKRQTRGRGTGRPTKPSQPAGPQRRVSASYLALVRAYPLHPIRSDEDLDEAVAVLDKLMVRRKALDPQEQDYFDSLSHPMDRFETEATPMPAVSGAAMLRHLIEARDAKLSQVAAGTGV